MRGKMYSLLCYNSRPLTETEEKTCVQEKILSRSWPPSSKATRENSSDTICNGEGIFASAATSATDKEELSAEAKEETVERGQVKSEVHSETLAVAK